jgi:hypothetical protein
VRLIGGDALGWADLDRSLQLALASGVPERVAGDQTNLAAMAVSGRQYAQASAVLDRRTWRIAKSATWILGGSTCSRIGRD